MTARCGALTRRPAAAPGALRPRTLLATRSATGTAARRRCARQWLAVCACMLRHLHWTSVPELQEERNSHIGIHQALCKEDAQSNAQSNAEHGAGQLDRAQGSPAAGLLACWPGAYVYGWCSSCRRMCLVLRRSAHDACRRAQVLHAIPKGATRASTWAVELARPRWNASAQTLKFSVEVPPPRCSATSNRPGTGRCPHVMRTTVEGHATRSKARQAAGSASGASERTVVTSAPTACGHREAGSAPTRQLPDAARGGAGAARAGRRAAAGRRRRVRTGQRGSQPRDGGAWGRIPACMLSAARAEHNLARPAQRACAEEAGLGEGAWRARRARCSSACARTGA